MKQFRVKQYPFPRNSRNVRRFVLQTVLPLRFKTDVRIDSNRTEPEPVVDSDFIRRNFGAESSKPKWEDNAKSAMLSAKKENPETEDPDKKPVFSEEERDLLFSTLDFTTLYPSALRNFGRMMIFS